MRIALSWASQSVPGAFEKPVQGRAGAGMEEAFVDSFFPKASPSVKLYSGVQKMGWKILLKINYWATLAHWTGTFLNTNQVDIHLALTMRLNRPSVKWDQSAQFIY